MSKKLLFRLAVLVAAMMCALGVSAQEAYACYTPSNTTLTFYYDNQRSSRTGTFCPFCLKKSLLPRKKHLFFLKSFFFLLFL